MLVVLLQNVTDVKSVGFWFNAEMLQKCCEHSAGVTSGSPVVTAGCRSEERRVWVLEGHDRMLWNGLENTDFAFSMLTIKPDPIKLEFKSNQAMRNMTN